jgi:Flp pilus assembly pilin Flp
MAMRAIRGIVRSDSGAAAIEFAIIIWALIFLCLGIIEIGRGLHVRNEMSYAADLAARRILTFEAYSADPLMEADEDALELEVREAFKGPRPGELDVTFPLDDSGNFRVIVMSYPFSLLIPGLRDTFDLTVTRRVPIG